MKKILLTMIGMAAGAALVHAQGGLIQWVNLSAGDTTNTTPYSATGGYPSLVGGTSGKVSTWSSGNHFYFALLTATTTNAADEGNPAGPDWSVVLNSGTGLALQGTNAASAGSMSGDGGANGVQTSLNAGQVYYELIVGWSANLGTSWAQVSSMFADGFSGNTVVGAYAGYSEVGTITPASVAPAASVFGQDPGSTLVLYNVPVPEPTTLALAGLGGLSMLFLRRRKS